MTPSARVPGADGVDADKELLAAVYTAATEEAENHYTADGGSCMCGELATFGHQDMEACRAALAAAGRRLTERLRAEAERVGASEVDGYEMAAEDVARWCGAPSPEGAEVER